MRDAFMRIPFSTLWHTAILLIANCISLFSQQAYREIDLKNGGTIRGTVKLFSALSTLDQMPITKNNDVCGKAKLSPRISIGKNNGVANAIVYLEGINEGKRCEKMKKLRLNQTECEYVPHVMIVPPGTHLEIMNNDVILHNVHAYECSNTSRSVFNIAQPIKGQCTQIKDAQFSKPGLIKTTCDAGHPWMSAYIMVASHPYYAVSDANGSFALLNVPPGTYKLKMWHEGIAVSKTEMEKGKVKKYYFEEPYESLNDVTITANGTVESNFELKLRQSKNVSETAK